LTAHYPVPYTLWVRKKGIGRIPTDIVLHEALPLLQKKKLTAQPIGMPNGSWQTITENQKALSKIEGKNTYQARLGARVEPYGIFWLEIREFLSNGNLLVRNLTEYGKRKIQSVEETIEPDLVYPAVRGADIQRWKATPGIHVLMSQDPEKSEAHYLCAIINSSPVREFIRSYSSAGRGFGAPSVMNHLGINRFDPHDSLHHELAKISKTLHGLKARNELGTIERNEKELDSLIYRLFGMQA
jgi:hypothetical protein